jgi:hypothetical protein
MKQTVLLAFATLALLSSPLAQARSHGGSHAHYGHQGGHYAGGKGSSHKGGHYKNAKTHDHYTKHNGSKGQPK